MAIPSTMTSRFSAAAGGMPPEAVIFGRSDVMRTVRATVHKGAPANVPVLLYGESGTGKNVLARFIHSISPWSAGPFVKISCPNLRDPAQEHETFGGDGPERQRNAGRVHLAEAGTLFFDEVTGLTASSQARLLEFLQERGSMGADGEDDVRVLCAASRNLDEEVAQGRFRQDLYYRLNVISVRVPSLRERQVDVPVLAEHFYRTFSARYHSAAEPLSERFVEFLCTYAWPGNVRELENVIKRYVILGSAEAIYAELAPKSVSENGRKPPRFVSPEIGPDQPVALKEITRAAVRDVERDVILKTLEANGWNRRRAARALSISYRALMYKMKGVEAPNGNGHRFNGK
jgi:two-component system response regulator AtoC